MRNLVSLDKREMLYLAAILFAMAIVSLLATRPGAGWHYLYPFAPFSIDVALRHVYAAQGPKAGAFRAGVLGLAWNSPPPHVTRVYSLTRAIANCNCKSQFLLSNIANCNCHSRVSNCKNRRAQLLSVRFFAQEKGSTAV